MDPIFASFLTSTIFAFLITMVAIVAIAFRQEEIASLAIKALARLKSTKQKNKTKDEDEDEQAAV